MAKILKGNIHNNKKSHTSCLVATIKNLIIRSVKELRTPVLSFRITQEAVLHKRNILADFCGNLGKAMKNQNRTPLEYDS